MIKFEWLFGPRIDKSTSSDVVELCDQAAILVTLHTHRVQLVLVVLRKCTEIKIITGIVNIDDQFDDNFKLFWVTWTYAEIIATLKKLSDKIVKMSNNWLILQAYFSKPFKAEIYLFFW